MTRCATRAASSASAVLKPGLSPSPALHFRPAAPPHQLLRLRPHARPRPVRHGIVPAALRCSFSSSASAAAAPNSPAKNQIYDPVRNTDSFHTYLSISSSSRTPLLTLWTASWCPSCRTISPLLRSLVASGIGEAQGGVAFVEIEFDSPDLMAAQPNPAMTYMITSVPTLLSFDAAEAQTATKVSDVRRLSDRQFLADWIRTEAARHGGRGGGGGGGNRSVFSGLFGS